MPRSTSFALPTCAFVLAAAGAGYFAGTHTATVDAGAVAIAAQPEGMEAMPPEMLEMMQRWDTHRQVSDDHKQLQKNQGTWLVTSRYWVDPQAPAQETQMVAESTPIMGGLFMMEKLGGIMDMGAGPAPWSGMSITGYDNTSEEYVFIWFDSASSSITRGTGTQTAMNQWTYEYDMFDPMRGESVPHKHIIRSMNDDEYVMEMHAKSPDGEWARTMELTYTRAN